jgi:glycosyltransferase involved in cell wall biosynthesis
MAKIGLLDVTATVSYGGLQTAIWQMAIALSDLGHEISVIGGKGLIEPDLKGRPIQVLTFPFRPRKHFPNLGTRFRKLAERLSFLGHARKAVVAESFDWIVITKPYDFLWPWLMPAKGTTRFAFLSGGTDFFRGDKILSGRISAWFSCSHFNAWQIRNHYKIFPKVIFNGVDTDMFKPSEEGLQTRTQLGVAESEILFGFAGRLVGWKGLEIALRAMSTLQMKESPVKLLVIGTGPQESFLKSLAHELNISDRIIFPGAIPHQELPSYYAAVDVGVFSSIADEAFGITIAEAMSCGKPVVASYIGGIPEVVGNEGHCGILCSPGNVEELAQAMHALASSPELREAMGKAARERVASLYTWELSAKRMLVEMIKK